MRLRVRNHTGPFFLDWMCCWSPTLLPSSALGCSAHTADQPPWVSPHVCTSAVTMAHCRLSCLAAQLWLHPLAELLQWWAAVQLTSSLKGTVVYPEWEYEMALLSLKSGFLAAAPRVNKKQMFPSDLQPANDSKALAGNLWFYKLLSTLKPCRPCNVFALPLAPVDIGVCFQQESKCCWWSFCGILILIPAGDKVKVRFKPTI